jgi:hypothetical protein
MTVDSKPAPVKKFLVKVPSDWRDRSEDEKREIAESILNAFLEQDERSDHRLSFECAKTGGQEEP